MQDHAKQKYIFGHLSLIRSLALDIPSRIATVRDMSLKKDIWVLFRATLFLGKWYGVTTYFFFIQKKKKEKNTNYKIHDRIVPFID